MDGALLPQTGEDSTTQWQWHYNYLSYYHHNSGILITLVNRWDRRPSVHDPTITPLRRQLIIERERRKKLWLVVCDIVESNEGPVCCSPHDYYSLVDLLGGTVVISIDLVLRSQWVSNRPNDCVVWSQWKHWGSLCLYYLSLLIQWTWLPQFIETITLIVLRQAFLPKPDGLLSPPDLPPTPVGTQWWRFPIVCVGYWHYMEIPQLLWYSCSFYVYVY